ncbi:hypothetical protein BN59_01683 [Legionella massiliensis]|uniref:Uncharacterized protein n=1 Tax=Legionella massiliensis TaxID=1034943 RepID=A0A078KSH4_9GAMM|nr:hypothetical protein [Legionella massiliensis]CDZ77400.1 hypothetical protein BN59_01683 [Legionella massiliensis]CEE13138.1 hypothetical protein BN1094_01683 [Legionella massiliensis]
MNQGKILESSSYFSALLVLAAVQGFLIMLSIYGNLVFTPSLYPWTLGAFILAFATDRSLILLSQSLKIEKPPAAGNNRRSKLFSNYVTLSNLIGSIVFIFLLYTTGKTYFLPLLKQVFPGSKVAFSSKFFALIAGYLIYLITRSPLKNFFNSFFDKIAKPSTYKLINDGIEIEFNITNLGKQNLRENYNLAFLSFEHIERIHVFPSRMDASSYYQYQISPSTKIHVAKDFAKQNQKQPDYYIGLSGNNCTNVLIEGPNLFYLIGFKTKDATDLTDAFKAFKERG